MELQYFKTDKNGTKYFHDWKCPRCAGAGFCDKWAFTGRVCFECGGTGKRRIAKIVKEYTPEYWAKLEAKRQAKAVKKTAAMFGDLCIERRDDIDDLYAYGTISEKKRDRLVDLWEQGEQHDWFYEEKVRLLQDAYSESLEIVRDLERKP